MTCAKTVIYGLSDYYCGPDGWCATGHNSWKTWLTLYVLPNGVWIVVPFIVTIALGRMIISELRVAGAARVAAKSI